MLEHYVLTFLWELPYHKDISKAVLGGQTNKTDNILSGAGQQNTSIFETRRNCNPKAQQLYSKYLLF